MRSLIGNLGALIVCTPLAAFAQISEIIDSSGGGGGSLARPIHIAAPPSGKVYVAGLLSNNAFEIDGGGGMITEIIDSTGDGSSSLTWGYGMAVDSAGNAYVSGHVSDSVFKIEPGGAISEIIDSTGDEAGNLLEQPAEIAVDSDDNVYVVGILSDNVFKITPTGTISEIIDETGDGAGTLFDRPSGQLAVGSNGHVFVANLAANAAVFEITPAGAINTILDVSDGLVLANEVVVDWKGAVYVSQGGPGTPGLGRVFRRDPNGTVTVIIDEGGDNAGHPLENAYGLAVDRFRNVYVAGRDSNNVFQITRSGTITQILDGTGDGVNPLMEAGMLAVDDSDPATITVYAGGFTSYNVFAVELPAPQVPAVSVPGLVVLAVAFAAGAVRTLRIA